MWIARYNYLLQSLLVEQRSANFDLVQTQFVQGAAFDADVGDIGAYPSLTRASDGTLRVTYIDRSRGRLMAGTQSAGQWETSTVPVNSGAWIGRWGSLALDGDDRMYVAYRNDTKQRLEMKSLNSSSCAPDVDDPANWLEGSANYGEYPSIAIAGSSQATARVVAGFYDRSHGNLVVATCLGEEVSYQVVDGSDPDTGTDTGNVGQWISLAIDPKTGNPSGAYFDRTRGVLRFFESNQGQLDIVVVDDGRPYGSVVGQQASLAYDLTTKRPRVGYIDATQRVLKFAHRSQHGTWKKTQVPSPKFDTVGGVGLGLDLTITATGDGILTFSEWTLANSGVQLKPGLVRCSSDQWTCEVME